MVEGKLLPCDFGHSRFLCATQWLNYEEDNFTHISCDNCGNPATSAMLQTVELNCLSPGWAFKVNLWLTLPWPHTSVFLKILKFPWRTSNVRK